MKMTKAKRFGAVIVLTLLPLLGFSKGLPFLKVSDKEAKVLTLRMATDATEKFKISLKDNFGKVLFSENVANSNGYIKSFDLKNLTSGEYTIEMENETYTKVMPVTIDSEAIVISHPTFETVYHPYVKVSDKKMDLNYLNVNQEATAMVIRDAAGNIIFKNSLGSDLNFSKRFDLSKLPVGSYNVEVLSGKKTFYNTIEVKN
ncbi:hypothetical protein [Fulvivirga sp.]|uniref:DUF3244 domain-containing protein n=2 Tax=Fulvivirga sp. TaxID=1931237 RepID=UPI0032ED170F